MLTRKAFYRTVLSGFILLIAVTLLFACTPLETSEYGNIEDSGIVMTTEYQTYAADVREIFVTIHNNSGAQASYGVMWELEKLEGSEWKTIPFKPNVAWIEPLYLIDDGAEDMFEVQLDILDYKLSAGTYRVVKEISGVPVAAEFTVAPKHYELNGTEYSVSLPIYLCTDVYITEDTQTHGEGTISLTIDTNRYQVSDCKLILCEDGCSAASVVSRASQGYAVAYNTIANGKFVGNYYTMKFAMEIPEPMVADLVNQGIYEQLAERLAREYYYLLELDPTHYAYICIKPIEGTEKVDREEEIVDGIVRFARVEFTTESAEDTTEPPVITTQPIEYILPLDCSIENGEFLYPVSAYGDVLYFAYSKVENVGIYPLNEGYGTGYVTVAKRNNFVTPSIYYYTYRITCKDGAVVSVEKVETLTKPAVLENGKPYTGTLEGEHQSKSYSYDGDIRMRTVVFSGDNVEIYSYIDGTDAGGKYFGPYQYDKTTGYFSAELTFEWRDGSTMELKQEAAGTVSGRIYEYCGFVHFICNSEKVPGLTVSESDPLPMTFAMPCVEDASSNNTGLYKKASDFLRGEFHRVYDPYYDIQSLTVSDWKENGNEATFLYNMTYIYYNRDPDKVEYIREAKGEDEVRYTKMYEDYLAPKEMNCEFKIVLNGDEIELYANVSPTGTQWERRNIDDYVLA